MKRTIALLSLAMLLLLTAAAPALAAHVKFKNVAVHDPSIMRAEDGRYYIYGSHMQAAWSDDLVNWKLFSKIDKCTLQPEYAVEFKEALQWAETGTFWASDVIRLADGRYYMYYCTCEGSKPLAALGVAVADSPEGPFENIQILLKSGEPGYDATVYPNAIDPNAFFDASGERLYMVYGSYSGGIYLLELDPTTGLILEGQEPYGIHLLGGNHSCIEAPYIVYNPETEYYYLFLSFGGLEVNDGYNIRVCRSKNVEGPYEDAMGNAMTDCKCQPGNFWNNDDIAPYGTKLMGGYQFTALEGENTDKATTIRSPGHNSVYYDAEGDRWVLIHHTRFKGADRYIVQTREMKFNDFGWPCVAPVRMVTEIPADAVAKTTGRFKLLRHEQDVNCEEHVSVEVAFGEDGTVSGGMTGTFIANDDGTIIVTADGVEYHGFYDVGYDADHDAFVTTITAMSQDGQTLWGLRATGQE